MGPKDGGNLAERTLAAIWATRREADRSIRQGDTQDPALILLHCIVDERVTRRHEPTMDAIGVVCRTCHHYDRPVRYPCQELLDRAEAYMVPLTPP